jgi:hypothetical protein
MHIIYLLHIFFFYQISPKLPLHILLNHMKQTDNVHLVGVLKSVINIQECTQYFTPDLTALLSVALQCPPHIFNSPYTALHKYIFSANL